MTNNSQNSELSVESQETNTVIPEKKDAAPDGMDAADKAKEDVVKPAPKSRGRPAGSKDNKPRIKRVPVQQPPPPQPQETVANEATPNKSRKKVEIRYEEEPESKPKKVSFQYEEEESVEEPPPPPKSPRTLHKERVQAAAMQRRQIAQARQDHFERILDNFMGF